MQRCLEGRRLKASARLGQRNFPHQSPWNRSNHGFGARDPPCGPFVDTGFAKFASGRLAMFPIPLMTSGTGFHAEASSSQSNCPPPPYVVHKAVEFSLQESACSIRAVKEALEAGRLEDAVVYLESLQAKLVPLGKVADAQIRAHGRKPRGQAAETPIIDVVATRAFPESSVPPIPVPTSTVDPALVAETRRVMRHLTAVRFVCALVPGLRVRRCRPANPRPSHRH
jgi:hypothetical protein